MYFDKVIYARVYLSIARIFYAVLAESHFRCNCGGLIAGWNFLHLFDLPVQVSYFSLFSFRCLPTKAGTFCVPSKLSRQLQYISILTTPSI